MINYRRLRWAGHVARIEEDRSVFKMLTGKPTRKRPLERPRCRWEGILECALKEWVSLRGIGLIRPSIRIIGEPLSMWY